jgi:hypothetical protein
VQEVVRRYILDHAPDPAAVWFDGWNEPVQDRDG